MSSRRRPLLIVLSAASGAGKSSLCRALLEQRKDTVYSVSCTTRAPRGGEVDGQSYHFLTQEAFRARVESGAFLEYAEVHGNYYGTLRQTVEEALGQDLSVVMDIDVQGARQVREALAVLPETNMIRQGFVDVFIHAPSMEELRRRLEARGEDRAEVIVRRLANARVEVESAHLYKYAVVNDTFERALSELMDILDKEQSL